MPRRGFIAKRDVLPDPVYNSKIVTKLCQDQGIKVAGIIKGFGGIVEGAEEMARGGCYQIGSSRIEQLKALKDRGMKEPLLLVRPTSRLAGS